MNRSGGQFQTPPVVKYLIIINALLFLVQSLLPMELSNKMVEYLALFFWQSEYFMPHQFVTHMFMHANVPHIAMNMFALWMFGRILEYDLGSKRFLIYYMITGIGAALMQTGVSWIEISHMQHQATELGANAYLWQEVAARINMPTVGASGAVFGVLLAFGMLHPNSQVTLLFPPIPMKAKYFVIGYGALELFLGMTDSGSNIAHFAHVGGMVWGYFLLRWWKYKGQLRY